MRLARKRAGRLVVAACLTAALAAPVAAAPYELFISVETEQDLADLFGDGAISIDTFDTLVELLRSGVDLSTASRDELYLLPNLTYAEVDRVLAYRKQAGGIPDPAALVAAGVLTKPLLLAIAPFLIIRARETAALIDSGRVGIRGLWTVGADNPPPGVLWATATTFDNISAGVAVVATHQRLGEVRYDPFRLGLSAEGPAARVHVPKFYLRWTTGRLDMIAGTYRIGFGQRLTFDSTDQQTPNGIRRDLTTTYSTDMTRSCKQSTGELDSSPCGGDLRYLYTTPDFSWRQGQQGVALGLPKASVGNGWLQAYAFASYQHRSIYQYQVYDRGVCLDPRLEDDSCSAPPVFEQQADPAALAPGLSYFTLPGVYAETLGGANVSYFRDRRTHVGITGYGAQIDWRVDGIDLDFQEWSPYPFGGPFGAVGVNAALGAGTYDLAAEVAHSFDSMPGGGGGFGSIVRTTTAVGKGELTGSLRYYDKAFANPYGRPVAAADTLEGNRARDEAGVRLEYAGAATESLELRGMADLWVEPSEGIPKVDLRGRASFEQSARFRWGMWLEYRNNNASVLQGVPESTIDDLDAISEFGVEQKLKAAGSVRYQPFRRLAFTGQYQHSALDERSEPSLRHDSTAVLQALGWPTEDLRVRARYRFKFEDIRDNAHLEQSHRVALELTYRRPKQYRLRARYDFALLSDDRASTAARSPNPQHWFLLQAETWF